MRVVFLTMGVYVLFLFFIPPGYTTSSQQRRLSLEQRLEIYCEEQRGKEDLCQEYLVTLKKRLEIKGELLLEMEEFCKKNNVKSLCRPKSSANLSLYCSRYKKDSLKCQEWRAWKHKELEIKGKLIERLQVFCKNNPKSKLCHN